MRMFGILVAVQVQGGVGQLGGVRLHHGAGGASLQQPLPRGQQRDAAVVHVQPPGTRTATWGGEFKCSCKGNVLKPICNGFSNSLSQCVTNQARNMGIHSSLHMPDKVLNFVKDHFLMDSVIRSSPLLLKRSVRYTQIAVHKIQGMERAYDVLFIGTGGRGISRQGLCGTSVCVRGFMSIFCHLPLADDGKLHKAINANDKMHIIEEMVLFAQPEPVQHIELDPQRVNHRRVEFVMLKSGLLANESKHSFLPLWLSYKCHSSSIWKCVSGSVWCFTQS